LIGERSSNGRWQAEPAPAAKYTTRVLVRRPVDPEHFSGTAVVEWLNVSGELDASIAAGHVLAEDRDEILALAAASAAEWCVGLCSF
jgi:hypothetical protein